MARDIPVDRVLYRDLNMRHLQIDRAEGMYLYDSGGRRYLDAAGGIGVVTIGHGVPEIIEAICAQARRVCFAYGGTTTTDVRIQLAAKLVELAPPGMDKVFFCSGGSEAVESSIKLARQYHLDKGEPTRYKVIGRWLSYHGNTLTALSVGGRTSWRSSYDPYLLDFPHVSPCNCYRCPFGLDYPGCGIACAWELERVIKLEGADTVAAFMLEPVIGTTATATVPPPEYLPIVRDICDRYGVLLIVDEVITGLGRTGKNFAVDHWGVVPDIIVTAKGLSSGYAPLGAVIAHKRVVEVLCQGSGGFSHSFTYAGNPLSCATGLAVINYLEEHGLVEQARIKGGQFLEKLNQLKDLPMVGDVRGLGLLLGVELVQDKTRKVPYPAQKRVASLVTQKCLEAGVIIIAGVTGSQDGIHGDHLQISPPFIITEEQMDEVTYALRQAIGDVTEMLA